MLKRIAKLNQFLLENIELIICAYCFALLIKCFFIENYKIPTSSMEPTLLGDANNKNHPLRRCPFRSYHTNSGGDQIMVTKFFYTFEDIKRFDSIVFKFPLNISKNFIKRVVGLPEEYFFVYNGDIFFKKSRYEATPPMTEFEIAKNPFNKQQSIWIRADDSTDYLANKEEFYSYWEPTNDESTYDPIEESLSLKGKLSYKQPLRDESDYLNDLKISATISDLKEEGAIKFTIKNTIADITAKINGQEITLYSDTTLVDSAIHELTDETADVEAMFFDGQFIFSINGNIIFNREYVSYFAESSYQHNSNGISITTEGNPVAITNLSLHKDIYYKITSRNHNFNEGEPYYIPVNSYIVFGDNVHTSHDSRAWKKKTFRNIEYEASKKPEYDQRGVIVTDVYGNDHIFDGPELDVSESQPSPFVKRRYIIGKAFFIWWPPGRWFSIIR